MSQLQHAALGLCVLISCAVGAECSHAQSIESGRTHQPDRLRRMPVAAIVRGQQAEARPAAPAPRRVSASTAADSLQLSPRTAAAAPATSRPPTGSRAVATVVGSLAIVLAIFFAVVWITRRSAPTGLAWLPTEVVESLGRAPLAARQQMQLIRLGNRLLLLSVTPQGAETLAEVSDPDEVDRLAGLCQQQRPGSASDTFRSVLTQIAAEPTRQSFLDTSPSGRGRRST